MKPSALRSIRIIAIAKWPVCWVISCFSAMAYGAYKHDGARDVTLTTEQALWHFINNQIASHLMIGGFLGICGFLLGMFCFVSIVDELEEILQEPSHEKAVPSPRPIHVWR